ncbi:MAG: hypothetical protein ACKVW3_02230 [Phycisphaerales bacterium]
MRSSILAGCATLPLLLAGGCASKNEGSTDHRLLTRRPDPNCAAVPGCGEAMETASKFIDAPADGNAINKGLSITITLDTAFIASFQEMARPFLLGDPEARGEIAIVVNVKELDGAGIDYSPTATESGRVVYYNEDVRLRERVPATSGGKSSSDPGQFLNFGGGLPVYGPVTWKGSPLLLEIHIIELDEEEASRTRELMQTLAGLGAKAYPPASPALAVLDSLGSALLKGPQNDTELSYHVVLQPYTGRDNRTHSYLCAGDLVVVKRDHIRAGLVGNGPGLGAIPWDELTFDRSTKRLRIMKDRVIADYRNHTYMVLNIRTGEDARANDAATEMFTLAKLQASINRGREATIQARADDLREALTRVESISTYQRDIAAIRGIDSSAAEVSGIETLLRPAIERLLDDLSATPDKQVYTDEQRQNLVSQLQAALRRSTAPDKSKIEGLIKKLNIDELKGADLDSLLREIKAALTNTP